MYVIKILHSFTNNDQVNSYLTIFKDSQIKDKERVVVENFLTIK